MTKKNRGVETHAGVKRAAFSAVALRPDLAGEPYVNLLRCSAMSQADTSPDGQKEVNDAFAAANGMRWAGVDVLAEGVSGSQTFNREDIDTILQLKRDGHDFSVVIVFELGRLTRGGIRHGNVSEDRLLKAGITVVSSTELIPDGPIGDLIKAVKHFGNQQQAFNISKSVARGLAQSLAKASRPAASRTPYGLDRLYVGPSDAPRVLIRWDGDVQLRLNPHTLAEEGRSVRPPIAPKRKKGQRNMHLSTSVRRKKFAGYVKQPDERSRLVAGSPERLAIVRWAWEQHYVHGWGTHRLVQDLTRRNVPSPFGGRWCLHSIQYILENPIYLGVEVRNRWTKALYHMLGPSGPVPRSVNQDALERAGRMTVPTTERLRDDWVLTDVPALKDVLPPHVRNAALPWITAMYDEDAVRQREQSRKARRKHKGDKSDYVLSGILHSALTGKPMRGDSSTKMRASGKKKRRRYYFDYSTAQRAITGPTARRVPADALEAAVVPEVLAVLADNAWVAERVRAQVDRLNGDGGDATPHTRRDALVAERAEITRRLERIFKHMRDLAEEELAEMIAGDHERLRAIRSELKSLDARQEHKPPHADAVVAAVLKELDALPKDWSKLPYEELKDLLAAFLTDLTVDPSTRKLSFTVRIPPWDESAGVADAEAEGRANAAAGVRVSLRSPWPSAPDPNGGIALAEVSCDATARGRCYACRRKLAA